MYIRSPFLARPHRPLPLYVVQPIRRLRILRRLTLPKAAQILADLRPGHPRLIASTERFDQLKRDIKSDQTLARWYKSIRSEGEEILRARPSQYEIPDGKRLLATSRRVLDRVTTLGVAVPSGRRPPLRGTRLAGTGDGGQVQGLEPIGTSWTRPR